MDAWILNSWGICEVHSIRGLTMHLLYTSSPRLLSPQATNVGAQVCLVCQGGLQCLDGGQKRFLDWFLRVKGLCSSSVFFLVWMEGSIPWKPTWR